MGNWRVVKSLSGGTELLPLVACLVLAGCSPGPDSPTGPSRASAMPLSSATNPRIARTRFLAFGDSLTLGEVTVPIGGVAPTFGPREPASRRQQIVPSAAYPSQLLGLLKARYVSQAAAFTMANAGRAGEYAYEGANRFADEFALAQPQVVLLLEGVNGLTIHGTGLGLVALADMTREGRAAGARVLLATLPPIRAGGRNTTPPVLLAEMNAGIRRVAATEGALLVEIHDGLLPDVNTLIGVDGLHPTEAGYKRMAEIFFASIRSDLEIK